MLKSDAKKLVSQMRDYIPGGKPIADITVLTFRRAAEHEVLLCGTQTGRDIQSGPFYCGAVADWVALTPDGTAAVCTRHANKIGIRREEGSR